MRNTFVRFGAHSMRPVSSQRSTTRVAAEAISGLRQSFDHELSTNFPRASDCSALMGMRYRASLKPWSYEQRGGLRSGYNIVFPAWELPRYPEVWARELDRFDEVWAASPFRL